MPIPVSSTLDFQNISKIINLPQPTADQDSATKAYVDSAVQGMKWKESVKVATASNIDISSPGATVDGISMTANDRVLVRAQTTQSQNGIYIWNGASTPLTRALDSNSVVELEQAVVSVEEGTSANSTFRQTQLNFTIGSGNIVWEAFGTVAPAATTTTAGIIEIATQGEVDTGTATNLAVTPETAKNASWGAKRFSATIGDGSATSYTVTHNLNTTDVEVYVRKNSGNQEEVLVEKRVTSVNAVQIVFDAAPSSNSHRVTILA